ncbi:glycosyl-4,4'-diaponeurosporenoate acyltransferase CrtO family protein [Chitinophaga rhizophila]|uniref:Glycosyl-4,4'-diaponeurosporenoate acyltransferase n=1 Tax=Chitinophaga rhizophila TaxID=2866212 RepID=A0ABS7GBQ7_9BACT|nr:hypothetical protein [Chitinophaga rhizophila]MBW8684766.1 hypothetical protein [Chitinophaga rhizophila]
MKRTVILILIPLVAVAALWALVRFIRMDSLSFAWVLNFLLMLLVMAFTETLRGPFTSPYYNAKQWERGGKVYEALGVNVFRKLLVLVGWEKLNKKSNPVEKGAEALAKLHNQTKKSELGHIIILFIVAGFNVFVAFRFGVLHSMWLLVLNILFNFYPIVLQRYNRPRIQRALSLSKRG